MTTIPADSPLLDLEFEIEFTKTLLDSLEGDTSEDAGRRRLGLEGTLNELSSRLERMKKPPASKENVIVAPGQLGKARSMGQSNSQPSDNAHPHSCRGGFGDYATQGDGSFGGSRGLGDQENLWSWGPTQNDNATNSALEQLRDMPLTGDVSSPDTSPATNSALSSPSLPEIPLGKRARDSFASAHPSSGGHQRKYRRTTPSPAMTGPTTPSSLDSFGMAEEDLQAIKALTGDFSTRALRDKAKEAEQRAKQERDDAEYARKISEEIYPQQIPSRPVASAHRPSGNEYSLAGPSYAPSIKSEHLPVGYVNNTSYLPQLSPLAPLPYQSKPFAAQPAKQLPSRPYIDLGSDDDVFEIKREVFQDNGRSNRKQPIDSDGPSYLNASTTDSSHAEDLDDILNQYDKVQGIQIPGASTADLSNAAGVYFDPAQYDPNNSAANASLWGTIPIQGLRQGAVGLGQSFKDTANAWYNGVIGANSVQPTSASPFTETSGLMNPFLPPYNQDIDFGQPSSVNALQSLDYFGIPQPRSLESILQDKSLNVDEPEVQELYQNYRSRYDYIANDPTKTKEELTSLLGNIRPDEELPPENREGTPEQMTYPLMEHQKLGLTWMKNMEDGSNKGGILADDMGLGKTIQALSLIVSRPSADPRRKTTLIIGPVALMKQWEREIQTKVKGGIHALTVYTLHGAKKGTWSALRNYDVVLTTYGTLASEFNRREAWIMKKRGNPNIQPGPADRLSLLADECKWYRVIIDEAQFIKNKSTKAARGACCLQAITRICMTGTPMMNNIGELFSLIEFLRIKPYNEIEKFNRDFTRPLKGGYGKEQAMRKLQALLKAILLRRTKKSKIDGQPILNLPERSTEICHVVFDEDEQAFYTALETKTQLQFNKYLKSGTVGKNYSNVLVLLLRLRQACCHPHLIRDFGVSANTEVSVSDMLVLAKELAPEVVDRIKLQEAFECPVCYDGVENPAIFIPCGHDTCSECFSKISDPALAVARGDEGTADIKCPTCRSKIIPSKIIDYNAFKKVHLGIDSGEIIDEEEVETASETETEDEDDGEDLKGFVVPDDEEDEETASESEEDYGRGDNPFTKSIGKSKSKMPKKKKDVKGKGRAKQPKAPSKSLAQLKKEGMRNVKARKRYMRRLKRDWISSAKLKKCVEILEEIQNRKEGEKTIIFSQFTSLLDLLEVPIDEQGWGYKRYDGSMSAVQRNQSVVEFTDRPDIKIMLVSLKAGNAGLNLVAASQVIILDPFWNPYVEEQAIDRSHRIGQLRPVQVHRILIKDTVEDRIIDLQNKKRELIEGALDEKASQSISRLGTRELAFLFGVRNEE